MHFIHILLQHWSEVADIKFQRVRGGDVTIEIRFTKGEMREGVLGSAHYPPHSDIFINDDKHWAIEVRRGKSSILADS